LAPSTAYVDIDDRQLIADGLRIAQATFGAVRVRDLFDMEIDQLLILFREVTAMAEKEPVDASGE